MIGQWAWVWRMRLMVTMCKYISVLYVDINKFAIVVVHNGPFKKKKKKKKNHFSFCDLFRSISTL